MGGGAGPAWGPEDFLEELSTELKLEWTSQGGLVYGAWMGGRIVCQASGVGRAR